MTWPLLAGEDVGSDTVGWAARSSAPPGLGGGGV